MNDEKLTIPSKTKEKPPKKRSIKRRILFILGILLFIFLGFYAYIILTIVNNDKAAGKPVYSGPIISDKNQQPIENEFDHSTTAMEAIEGVNLSGKVIVMTGGHTGTGLQAAKAFVSKGATVIALAPQLELAKNNLKGLPNVEIEYLDLLDIESIDTFVKKFLSTNRHIDVLVNSAGIYNIPLQRDERGYEKHFAINVLGHYELTLKLLPALKSANGARIVNLSSRGHRSSVVNFDDINYEHTPYDGFIAYCRSKTAFALVTVKQDELLKKYNIRSFAVHPGPIPSSDLFDISLGAYAPRHKVWLAKFSAICLRNLYGTEIINYLRQPNNMGDIYKTVQQGGATTAWAATNPQLNGKGGLYLEDSNIAPIVPNGSDAPFGVRPWALNKNSADRIWRICEEMSGVTISDQK